MREPEQLFDPAHPALNYPKVTKLVSGVFKGGGAKGVVYGGALHELRARGVWFDSVAGSSAGAITAALIAAGFSPDELLSVVPHGLQSVRINKLAWLRNEQRALFGSEGLRAWLERTLADKLGYGSDEPVTFAMLAKKSRIELNVVAMDLALREPIVFNSTITPELVVTEAVIASSAIPVGFPSRRILFSRPGMDAAVHRIVDGGTWANYPLFVYNDPAFRGFFGLPEKRGRKTLGFVISGRPAKSGAKVGLSPQKVPRVIEKGPWPLPWPKPEPADATYRQAAPLPSRFDLGSARRLKTPGVVLTWAGARWLIGVVAPVVGAIALIAWWFRTMSTIGLDGRFDPLETAGLFLATFGIALAAITALLLVVINIRFAPEGIEAGLPSIWAMTSIGPGVPRWIGQEPTEPAIRLSSPLSITTAKFCPPVLVQRLAVLVAAEQASQQLDEIFPDARSSRVPRMEKLLPRDDYRQRYAIEEFQPTRSGSVLLLSGLAGFVAIFGGAPLIILFLAERAAWPLLVLATMASLGLTVWFIKDRTRNQSLDRPTPFTRLWIGPIFFGTVAVVIAGVCWSLGIGAAAAADKVDAGTGYLFLNLAVVIPGIFGCSALIIGASRITTNILARRYGREIGVPIQERTELLAGQVDVD